MKASWQSTETEEPTTEPIEPTEPMEMTELLISAPLPRSAGSTPKACMAATEPVPPIAPPPGIVDETAVKHRPLPLWVRIGVFLVGWILVLVGIAGLVLPGIQGVLTILVGAALLSLVSEIAYSMLKKCLHRWPKAWDRVERFRDSAHDKLHRWFHREKDRLG